MRLPPLPPEQLNAEQKAFYDEMSAGIAARLKGFVSKRADGALVGPFNSMLQFSQFGKPVWDFIVAIGANPKLPKDVREVAILTVGAQHRSRYELYAHEHVAAATGLKPTTIAALVAGQRPDGMTDDQATAYDIAAALSRGGQLPEATYQLGLKAFGEDGMAELAYLIGCYHLVSVVLNAYDVSVPGQEEGVAQG